MLAEAGRRMMMRLYGCIVVVPVWRHWELYVTFWVVCVEAVMEDRGVDETKSLRSVRDQIRWTKFAERYVSVKPSRTRRSLADLRSRCADLE